jgi:putative ABC transport system permease protein
VFFGGLALLLAIAGIYGTVSYAVVQRTREMGIRLALGTTPPRLRAMLLRQTLATISAGAIVGVAAALGAGRYLQSLVEGAGGAMALTASLAVAGTLLVAAAAVWRATRRIARLDVSDVLRRETE